METRSYSEYSLYELYDVLKHTNKVAYPEKVELLNKEIEKRKKAGEVYTPFSFNVFLGLSIPLKNAISVWWCWIYRSFFAFIFLYIAFFILISISKFLGVKVPSLFQVVVFYILFFVSGFLGLRQALAKNYKKFLIKIIDKENI